MRTRSTIAVVLLLGSLAAACGSDTESPPGTTLPPPTTRSAGLDAAGLIERLQGAGAVVEAAGTFTAQGLTGMPRVVRVNGADVQLYEYPAPGDAAAEAGYLSADGGTIAVPDGGVFLPDWLATPHFFLGGRLIAQYIGDDPGVLGLLESVFGPQFAGGNAEILPPLIVGTVEPAEGAPMSFEEAAAQAESVVLAEVTSVEAGPDYVAGVELPVCRPSQLVTLRVLEAHKGPAAPDHTQVIYQTAGLTDEGSGCGDDPAAPVVLLIMDHDPLYDVGQRYLLAYSPLAGFLDPDPVIADANRELAALAEEGRLGQVLFSGRLLVDQSGHPDLARSDVVHTAYDDRGRAIPGPVTGKSLADYQALLAAGEP